MTTILIIEDEQNLSRLYKNTLKEEGYSVITTELGKEALKIIQTQSIDLVVLDIRLPDMDGIEVLCSILENRHDLPCIINTGYPMYKLDFRCWGAKAYICKSSDLSELTSTISQALNK
ncbi:MAG: response regulator [bacterium]